MPYCLVKIAVRSKLLNPEKEEISRFSSQYPPGLKHQNGVFSQAISLTKHPPVAHHSTHWASDLSNLSSLRPGNRKPIQWSKAATGSDNLTSLEFFSFHKRFSPNHFYFTWFPRCTSNQISSKLLVLEKHVETTKNVLGFFPAFLEIPPLPDDHRTFNLERSWIQLVRPTDMSFNIHLESLMWNPEFMADKQHEKWDQCNFLDKTL